MATQDVRLGAFTLQPWRQLLSNGTPVPLGRKPLDILSALANANGALVTKDELMEAVWPGLIVEENAIQAHMVALRKALGPEAERLKTVRGFGYRLETGENGHAGIAARPAPSPPIEVPSPANPARGLRRWWPVAAAVVLIGLVGLLVVRPWQGPAVPQVGIVADHGPGAAQLAGNLTRDLARLASARAGNLAVGEPDAPGNDYVLYVATRAAGNRPGADLSLVSTDSRELLWAASFDQSARGDLREQAAVRLSAVLLCATARPEQTRRLDTPSLRLFLTACDSGQEQADEANLANLRKLAERAPRFAPGLAELAKAEAEFGRSWPFGPPDERHTPEKQAMQAAAREHLLQARALDPSLAASYLAEEELLPRDRWAERLAVLQRGLAADPGDARLHSAQAHALMSIGRVTLALRSARRAAALDPLSPRTRATLIANLAYSGRHEEARRALDEAERIWPGSDAIEDARYRFELRYGDPQIAMLLFERYQAQTGPVDQSRARAQAIMEARLNPTQANVDRALELLSEWNAGQGLQVNGFYFATLAQHGRVEEAFALLERPEWRMAMRHETEVHFRDYTWPLREDARFMRFAARIGLLKVWQDSGRWPDFCQDARLRYDCREEARRSLGRATGRER